MIFLDTSFLFALFAKKEREHSRAREALEAFEGQHLSELLLTTDQVISETLTLTRKKSGHAETVFVGERLYSGKLASIHWVTPEEQQAGFEYLRKHQDKVYSAVDCVSFVVMLKLGITEALTFDRDFAHRFVVRPGLEGSDKTRS